MRDELLLPRLPVGVKREWLTVSSFGGLSVGRAARVGDAVQAVNLSSAAYPALSTRAPRGIFVKGVGSGQPHGLARWGDSLCFARGERLYRTVDGTSVEDLGAVSDTDKHFAVFGDRLLIFPDKLYLEPGGMPRPMELDTGVLDTCSLTGNTVTLPEGVSWRELGFGAGDGIRIINADDVTPAPEGYYRLASVRGRIGTLDTSFSSAYESRIRVTRPIPELDGLCVNGGRVYGFHGKEILVSGAGSAFDWYPSGNRDGSGPALLRVDSEGDFTACAFWQGYAVFFKPDSICRLLGNRADSLTVSEASGAGIPSRLAGTLCEIGGALYYHGEAGVYRYGGQSPQPLGRPCATEVTAGCGGTDGAVYYLSLASEAGRIQYLYCPETGVWLAEDALAPVDTVCLRGFCCFQDGDGTLRMAASDGRRPPCVFDERSESGPVRGSVALRPLALFEPVGGYAVTLCLRVSGEAGGRLRVMLSYSDGEYGLDTANAEPCEVACFTGGMTERLLRVPLVPRRCDAVTVRLETEGAWTVHGLFLECERGA